MVKCFPDEIDSQNFVEDDPVKWHITEKLIADVCSEQLPSGEEGKYARMMKFDIRKVTHLKIEYKSISVIDNLTNMASLTKLQLCNNAITKIENLDALVNLSWLDLSFNSISKIEGLDALTKLEVLDLHRNFITTLENMDNLLRLELFHISSNKLDNYENVRYLRRFVRLRSCSFSGNPMAKNPSFMPFLVAFVPQLSMVDYKLIPVKDRDVANAKYKTYVDGLAKTEDKLIRRASVVEAEEQVKLLHKDAFVDGFENDRFWVSLYENDVEGKEILQLEDTEDIQVMYSELFRRATRVMFDKGMIYYEMRQNEKKAYEIALKDEMEKVQKAGNLLTEEFEEYSNHTLRDIRILVSHIEDSERKVDYGVAQELPREYPGLVKQLNDMSKEFVKKLHNVWSTLIESEIESNEQVEDVNDMFDRSIRDIFQSWVEELRGQFGNLREVEEQLFGRLVESLVTYGEFRKSDTNIPESLKELVMDKDALRSHLQMSHDHQLSIIDSCEDKLSATLRDWQENFSIDLQTKEHQRNRARLTEIAHFADTFYGYLQSTRALLNTTVFIPNVRGDQDCEEAVCQDQPLLWYERLVKRLRAKERKFKASLNPQKKRKQSIFDPDAPDHVPSAPLSERTSLVL